MDMLNRLNNAIQYIEQHLCEDIDINEAAQIACVTKNSFMRFFSYMTGMTINEYIRRRRLSCAAYELQNTNLKVIDIAVKYGYDSADAFTKAFFKQHHITPSQAREHIKSLTIYPPASFHIIIKGAKEMDFRIINISETKIFGVSKNFDQNEFQTREALRHTMWDEKLENIPAMICEGNWNEADNHAYDGIWYGVWSGGKYMIAREKEYAKTEHLEKYIIPAGRYAAFTTKKGTLAWEELPKLLDLIMESWLPSSGYSLRSDDIIETYHLWTNHDMRKKNRYYEIWIPIIEK